MTDAAGPYEPTGSTARSGRDLGIPGLVDAVLIGRGGSGAVYRVRQPGLNRVVAVKILTAVLDPAGRERFDREAFVMGTVSGHPNIVQLLSSGATPDGQPYLLMPFFDGGSLADRTPIPWVTALAFAVRLCGALETAHRAGILHRDVKPANVLISAFGEPLLADFGISRLAGRYETSQGMISASIPYAPPEVLNAGPATVAADVYSLGATVFSMITGAAPFAARPDEELISVYLRITREPAPDLRDRGIPGPVCDVLDATLAKDPAQRPTGAADLGRRLQEVQRLIGAAVTPMALPGDPVGIDGPPAPTEPIARPALGPRAGTRTATSAQPRSAPQVVGDGDRAVPAESGAGNASGLRRTVARTATSAESPMTAIGGPPDAAAGPPDPARRPRRRRWPVVVSALVVVALLVTAAVIFWPRGRVPAKPAQLAGLSYPSDLAVTDDGSLYIADRDANQVVRITPTGTVEPFAGTGESGDTGDGRAATDAKLSSPSALAVAEDGTVYVATSGRIRRIGPDGVIRPVPGLPDTYLNIEALAVSGERVFAAVRDEIWVARAGGVPEQLADASDGFESINGMAARSDGTLLVSDSSRGQILTVTQDGTVGVLAGSGTSGEGGDARPALETSLSSPAGIAVSRDDVVYFADTGMNQVRRLEPDGTLLTVAGNPDEYGSGYSGDGGSAIDATFNLGSGALAVDVDGNLYIADAGNQRVRQVGSDGIVQTFA